MTGKKRRMLINRAREQSQMPSLIKAAEKGNLDAQHDLGASYAVGHVDGFRSEVEAIKWYTRAAEAGHALSQYDLGFMLILGEGTEKDVAKGLWWMEQAVKNGHEFSARVLSDFYRKGAYGVEPNPERAEFWNQKAGEYKDRI